MTRRRKFVIFSVIALIVVAGIAARAAGGGDRGVEVRLGIVERNDLVATVTASGQVTAQTAVDIASDITGRITSIRVEEGEWVKRGALLLTIDQTQFLAAQARAEAALSSARASALQAKVNRDQASRQLERMVELRATDSNLVSAEQFEQAQQTFDVAAAIAESQDYQVAQAQASLEEAREQLAKTVLRAPMDGQVTRLAVEEGEVALASTFSRETGLLMTISDLSVIQIDVRVDETDVVRLQLNDSAEVTVDAFPDTTFVGQVTKISQSAIQVPTGSSGDRAVDYDVEITLDNPPLGIRPDLSGTAKIVTDTRDDALSIPIIALTLREHQAISTESAERDTTATETEGVFVVENGTAQFRPVRVGIAGEEHFEVLDGLSEGDSIVAGPYQTIRDLEDSTAVRGSEESTDRERRAVSRTVENAAPSSEQQTVASAVDTAAAPPMADSSTVSAGAVLTAAPNFAVQVAAFRTAEAAQELVMWLRSEGYEPHLIHDADSLYKVRVGSFATRRQTAALAQELSGRLGEGAFVVPRS